MELPDKQYFSVLTAAASPGNLAAARTTDDLNLFLGWLCWLPPVAILVALYGLIVGSNRKAFQAIVVPIIYVPCIYFVSVSSRPAYGQRINVDAIWGGMLWKILTVIIIPLLTLYLLRQMNWPQRKEKT